MNSFIPWVGGKGKLLWIINKLMPDRYTRFVDVFGGSGTVTMCRPIQRGCMEVYNDFNGNLTNLFCCVKNRTLALLAELGFLPLNTRDDFNVLYINDFCWPDVCTMISPKQITQGDFQTVNGYAGTGPYIYDEYVAGQYTTFVRNENYWGEQPYYDKIVAKYIPDNASRVQALKTGEIDLIYGSAELSYEDYNQATAIDGIEGKFAPSGSTVRNIILNFNGNLSDLSVRQALAYAIDKEAISEGLTYGYEPVANTIVPDGTPYSDICGTEDYSYNVDRANQLLDEAGWIMNQSTGIREKNGTPLHVLFTCPTDDSTIGSIATLFQSQLAEVGIEVEIKSMEKMEWYASYMNPAGWDITAMTAGFFNYAMPQCWFSAMMAQMPEDVSISLLDNSDEFISALSEFKTCNDDARLKELFELLINTDLDQVLDVPLTHQMDMIVYNTDKIADYNFTSDYAFLDVTQITPAEQHGLTMRGGREVPAAPYCFYGGER